MVKVPVSAFPLQSAISSGIVTLWNVTVELVAAWAATGTKATKAARDTNTLIVKTRNSLLIRVLLSLMQTEAAEINFGTQESIFVPLFLIDRDAFSHLHVCS